MSRTDVDKNETPPTSKPTSITAPKNKTCLPDTYVCPEVWTSPSDSLAGTFGAINQPTAGSRFNRTLKRGDHPLQLYSLGTPNGQKVTILLEELGIKYDAWKINIMELDQFGNEFVDINPNSKIPALLDYSHGATATPQRVFESGSIMMYLAEKEEKFLPKATDNMQLRTECLNWLMWQMGTAPYIGGGFGHFYRYAPVHIEYAINRFSMETKRILDVLNQQLDGKVYVCGDEYTIADMAIFPWIRCLDVYYKAESFLSLKEYSHVQAWIGRMNARPAVQRGMNINYL